MSRFKGMIAVVAASLAVSSGWGCVADEEGKPEDNTGTGKEDRWNWENDPSRFQVEFKYKISELPMTGEAQQMPWSETWWPMRKDGFNQRWQDSATLSPLEKYDQAFNGWTPPAGFSALRPFSSPGSAYDATYYTSLGPAATWESRNGGNAQARNGRDDDSDGQTDESDWDGLGGWWGKCHMWSAVAVLAPEPQRAVTINGVTFEYSDVTALLMEAYYNRARSYMLGDRCNDEEIARDEHGRPTNLACRDTNAGSFHVVVTNMLGIHHRAFVMDKSADSQVWNHPVRDFNVTTLQEVPLAQACSLLGVSACTTYPFNPDARKFYEVRLTLGYVTDGVSPSRSPHGSVRSNGDYHYVLELDANDLIIGGEWIGETGPDFFWLPVLNTYGRGGNPSVKLADVETLLRMSTQTVEPPPSGSDTRVENTTPAAIPDNAPAGVTSMINATGTGTTASFRVAVDITHTFVGDLRITLKHGAKTVTVYSGAGGSQDNLVQEFDLPDFVGVEVGGAWELNVSDVADVDTGTLNKWAILYTAGGTTPAPSRRTVDAGSTTRTNVPDNRAAGVTGTLSVTDNGTVRDLVLHVDIKHPYVGDLKVTLRHLGTAVVVHNRTGGSTDDIVRDFTLADFNSTSVTGAWELVVSDNASRDKGYVAGWSIRATVE